MASNKMWEVDPETRSKLLTISKTNENNRCVDCGAPSPQWASPKFGIFFCLACSGIHRSLGVHISFVRSVTMDAFKTAEVKRMELGGNKPWKDFFNNHPTTKTLAQDFDACTIAERYDSEAGEEWKDRLTAKVEEREYIPGTSKRADKPPKKEENSTPATSGRNTPLSNPHPQRTTSPTQKSRNEAYFAAKGNENALRPDNLPPSQGGKYAGFGSSPAPNPSSSSSSSTIPTTDDFQKDPMAALTKGFGWLSSNLTKQAATLNTAYIQPGIKNLNETDFAAQARGAASSAGTFVQQGARGMNDQFTRFVDPESTSSGAREPAQKDFWDSFGQAPAGPPKERRDFWDDFAAAGEARQGSGGGGGKGTSIGTSAMKTSNSAVGGGGGGKKEDDEWGAW